MEHLKNTNSNTYTYSNKKALYITNKKNGL